MVWSIDQDRNISFIERDGTVVPKHKYDTVFGIDASNRMVYEAVARQFIGPVLAGVNGTIFAYGVTSSGKTHTMIGAPHEPGITPLLVRDLFESLDGTADRVYTIRMAYMEIYNEVSALARSCHATPCHAMQWWQTLCGQMHVSKAMSRQGRAALSPSFATPSRKHCRNHACMHGAHAQRGS